MEREWRESDGIVSQGRERDTETVQSKGEK